MKQVILALFTLSSVVQNQEAEAVAEEESMFDFFGFSITGGMISLIVLTIEVVFCVIVPFLMSLENLREKKPLDDQSIGDVRKQFNTQFRWLLQWLVQLVLNKLEQNLETQEEQLPSLVIQNFQLVKVGGLVFLGMFGGLITLINNKFINAQVGNAQNMYNQVIQKVKK